MPKFVFAHKTFRLHTARPVFWYGFNACSAPECGNVLNSESAAVQGFLLPFLCAVVVRHTVTKIRLVFQTGFRRGRRSNRAFLHPTRACPYGRFVGRNSDHIERRTAWIRGYHCRRCRRTERYVLYIRRIILPSLVRVFAVRDRKRVKNKRISFFLIGYGLPTKYIFFFFYTSCTLSSSSSSSNVRVSSSIGSHRK